MLALFKIKRRATGSRALMFLSAACVMSGLVACEDAAAAAFIRPPALASYVQPAGLRPVAAPGQQTAPLSSPSVVTLPRSPGVWMPAEPAAPAATPSVIMPIQSPGVQMPAAPAAPVVMMPAPVDSSGTQTGQQMFAGFFAGLASSFAIGFAITAKRMYDSTMSSEDSLKGRAGDLEFGKLPGRAGVPTMMVTSTPQVGLPARSGRVAPVKMYDISAYDDIWGIEAKTEIYDKWDPEKPRDYNNFNPFERNDEGQQCDKNGFFPGQDGGYMPPNRPDVSWDIMQENNKKMDVLKAQAKFNIKGKPGNWRKGWADGLGPAP